MQRSRLVSASGASQGYMALFQSKKTNLLSSIKEKIKAANEKKWGMPSSAHAFYAPQSRKNKLASIACKRAVRARAIEP